jgi:hypothetical protein
LSAVVKPNDNSPHPGDDTQIKSPYEPGVVVHTFNPSTQKARGRWISEFEASLVYKVSSRTARAAQRNSVSKNQNQTKPNQKQNKPRFGKPWNALSLTELAILVGI